MLLVDCKADAVTLFAHVFVMLLNTIIMLQSINN